MNDELQEQIAKIISLQGYEYRLWHYQASHSVLTVRAYQPLNPGHNLHIIFETVLYVQMSVYWETSNFRLGIQEEHRKIVAEIGLDEFTASQVMLFVAELPNSNVYILCHSVSIKHDVPPLY